MFLEFVEMPRRGCRIPAAHFPVYIFLRCALFLMGGDPPSGDFPIIPPNQRKRRSHLVEKNRLIVTNVHNAPYVFQYFTSRHPVRIPPTNKQMWANDNPVAFL